MSLYYNCYGDELGFAFCCVGFFLIKNLEATVKYGEQR